MAKASKGAVAGALALAVAAAAGAGGYYAYRKSTQAQVPKPVPLEIQKPTPLIPDSTYEITAGGEVSVPGPVSMGTGTTYYKATVSLKSTGPLAEGEYSGKIILDERTVSEQQGRKYEGTFVAKHEADVTVVLKRREGGYESDWVDVDFKTSGSGVAMGDGRIEEVPNEHLGTKRVRVVVNGRVGTKGKTPKQARVGLGIEENVGAFAGVLRRITQ